MEDYICSQIEESRIEFREEMRELQQHTKSQFGDIKSQFVEITGKLDAIIELLPDWLRSNGIVPVDLIVVPSDQVTSDLVDDLLEVNRSLNSDLNSEKVCVTTQSWIDSEVHMAKNDGSTCEEISEETEAAFVAFQVFDEMSESIREALLEDQIYTKSDLLLDGIFGDVQPIEEQAQGNDSSAFKIHEIYLEKKVYNLFPEMSMSCDELSRIQVQKGGSLVSVTSIAVNQKEKVAGPYAYHIFDEMTPSFRTEVMNEQLMAPYTRGINSNKLTLFDPGGKDCVVSMSSGIVFPLITEAPDIIIDGLHGVDDLLMFIFEPGGINYLPLTGCAPLNSSEMPGSSTIALWFAKVQLCFNLGGFCLLYNGCENFELHDQGECWDERMQSCTAIIGSHSWDVNMRLFVSLAAKSAPSWVALHYIGVTSALSSILVIVQTDEKNYIVVDFPCNFATNKGFSSMLNTKKLQGFETAPKGNKVLRGMYVIAFTPGIFIFPKAVIHMLDKESDWQTYVSSLLYSSQNKGSGIGHQSFDEMLGSFPIKHEICDGPYRHVRLSFELLKYLGYEGLATKFLSELKFELNCAISMFVFDPGIGAIDDQCNTYGGLLNAKCYHDVMILGDSKILEGAMVHPNDDVPAGLPIRMIPSEIARRVLYALTHTEHTTTTLFSSNSSVYQNAAVQRVTHCSAHLLDGFKPSQSGAKRCSDTEHLNVGLMNKIRVPIVTSVDHFSEMIGSNVMNIGLDMSRPINFRLEFVQSCSKHFAHDMLANDNDNVAFATLEDFIWNPIRSVTSFNILEDKDVLKRDGIRVGEGMKEVSTYYNSYSKCFAYSFVDQYFHTIFDYIGTRNGCWGFDFGKTIVVIILINAPILGGYLGSICTNGLQENGYVETTLVELGYTDLKISHKEMSSTFKLVQYRAHRWDSWKVLVFCCWCRYEELRMESG